MAVETGEQHLHFREGSRTETKPREVVLGLYRISGADARRDLSVSPLPVEVNPSQQATVMGWFRDILHPKQKAIREAFAGREPLDDNQFWKLYFQQYGVAPETAAKVREVLSKGLGTDLSRIRDTDDFSKNLAFFWDFDSLADAEIIMALEEQFGITITDGDAAAMQTVKDIVLGVHAKIGKPRTATTPTQKKHLVPRHLWGPILIALTLCGVCLLRCCL